VLASNGTAIGANAVVQAAATNSVAVGQGSVASAPNTVSVGAPGGERRITNVAPGVAPSDAATVGQLSGMAGSLTAGFQSQVNGLQSQINNNDRRLRDGVALAMAAGGVPAVPQGRKLGMFGNIATYDGHGAAGVGLTGVLYETRAYQVQANGSVGMGFDTSVVGGVEESRCSGEPFVTTDANGNLAATSFSPQASTSSAPMYPRSSRTYSRD
jgi:hypothetical protein